MGDIETKLKEMIIEKYGSLARFASEIDMSWTTLDSILKRGILKANIINVLKITNKLGIDTEELGKGSIVRNVDYMYKKDSESPEIIIEAKLKYDASTQTDRLLKYFYLLNQIGREEAIKLVENLSYVPNYTDNPPLIALDNPQGNCENEILSAAHEREDINVTDEMREHDDKIMDDENF